MTRIDALPDYLDRCTLLESVPLMARPVGAAVTTEEAARALRAMEIQLANILM